MHEDVAISLSEINLIPIKPNNGHLGWASFVLNGQFYVGNLALYSTPEGGIRINYIEKILPNGKKISIFHPITKEAGNLVLLQVTKKYNQLTGGNANGYSTR